MKQRNTIAFFVLIGVVLVFFVSPKVAHHWKRWRIEHTSISKPGPKFMVADIFGTPVDFSKSDDKVLLLQLWATWCPYCRADIPALMELQQRYQSRGLEIVGFSVDQDPDLVREFCRRYKLNYPIAMVDADVEKYFGSVLGIPENNISSGTPVPTSILIGRDGRIKSIYLGKDVSAFEQPLIRLLEAAPSSQALLSR